MVRRTRTALRRQRRPRRSVTRESANDGPDRGLDASSGIVINITSPRANRFAREARFVRKRDARLSL